MCVLCGEQCIVPLRTTVRVRRSCLWLVLILVMLFLVLLMFLRCMLWILVMVRTRLIVLWMILFSDR